jgi:hypothetical protein
MNTSKDTRYGSGGTSQERCNVIPFKKTGLKSMDIKTTFELIVFLIRRLRFLPPYYYRGLITTLP